MIRTRGRETVPVTKVKGHVEDLDVQHGRVRLEDQLGSAGAGAAADLGRRHQSEVLIHAWRGLLQVRSHWYPLMLQLHRLMIAVAVVGLSLVRSGDTCPGFDTWVGNSVLMGSLLGHWKAVSILVFGHFVSCLGILRVQQRSFWMAH